MTRSVYVLLLCAALVAEGGWKAGTARVVITPTEPMWMAGYAARDKPAEQKIHDLWLRVLALEDDNGKRAVIVASDVVGISRPIWDAILAQLGEEVDRDALMFNCSHTHSGPVMSRTLSDIYPLDQTQQERVERYTRDFEAKAVAAIREALAKLAPATLEVGEGKATFGVNRRNNPELDVPALRAKQALKGPSDPSVPILLVKNSAGKIDSIVFAYACHNTVLDSYAWCGDYAGFAEEILEEKFPGATALFVAGCGGDQNPIPRRQLELAKKYGKELADAVEVGLKGSTRTLSPRLQTRLELVIANLGDAPTRAELTKIAHGASGYQQRYGARLLAELDAGRPLARALEVPVQVWRIGDLLWISLAGEAVVDYALKFKETHGPQTWVTSYSNDVMAYLPSLRVLKEGGYEGASSMMAYGVPAYRWADDVEERITRSVDRQVRSTEHVRETAAR